MNSLGTVVRLRLKMTDFYDTEIEGWIINRINEIYKINQFQLHLWYENDEVSPAKIKEFIKKYENDIGKTEKSTKRRNGHFSKGFTFRWWNITCEPKKKLYNNKRGEGE